MKKFFLTLLNGKRTYVGLGINELTESEEFESNGSESTTANNYVIKSGFPYVTATKTAGIFRIEWFAEISNSQKQKVTGFRVRYRVGTSGGYTTIADSDDGTADNGTYYPVAGFKINNRQSAIWSYKKIVDVSFYLILTCFK